MPALVPTAADIAARVRQTRDQSVAALRQLRRQLSKELRGADAAHVIGSARQLIATKSFPRWIAYELVANHRDALATLQRSDVEALGAGMASWDQVDTYACYVAGVAYRQGQLTSNDILRWTKSADRWWRRAALVCTVPLNNSARGGTGDVERTLVICDALLADRDDMVVKAMSWALRELAKKKPREVEAYLMKHERVLAPRVQREVRNKLTTGLKNPRKNDLT
jgi:hypothetical protein